MKANESAEGTSLKSFYSFLLILSALAYLLLVLPHSSHAQVTTSIAADNSLPTPTTVIQAGNVFNINGGTIHGANQFHSFDTFSVGAGDIASFNGPGSIANILSRVTGLDSGLTPSMIYGTIQSTIPGANLFFMNPAGIVFGPTASLNVSGATHFTTADYLKLAEMADIRLNAIPGQADALITSAPVTAFGFLTDTPAAIEFRGSALPLLPFDPVTFEPVPVPVGRDISVVAGDIRLITDPDSGAPTILTAPGAKINLVSVASAGEVPFPSFDTTGYLQLATVTLSGSLVDVSGSAFEGDGGSGTVRIRAGRFEMDGGFILAATMSDTPGAETAVDIYATGDVSLDNISGILSSASAGGDAGAIQIHGENVTLAGLSNITSSTAGAGKSGNISVDANDVLSVHGTDGLGNNSRIESFSSGDNIAVRAGDTGNIDLTASTLTLDDQGIIRTNTSFQGQAGDMTLTVGALRMENGAILETVGITTGATGSITITGTGQISVIGTPGAAPANQTQINLRQAGTGETGSLSIHGQSVLITDGATVLTDNMSDTQKLTISAVESLTFSNGASLSHRNSFRNLGIGSAELSAPNFTLSNQVEISTSTIVDGNAGDLTLVGTNITVSGNSNVFSRTSVQSGRGGNITFTASDSVTIADGSAISASSLNPGTGDAGNISIDAGNSLTLRNSSITTEASQASGGKINIRAVKLVQLVESLISTSVSDGTGGGGDIFIDPNIVVLQNSQILARAIQGAGGNITIFTPLFLRDSSSLVSASSQFGLNGTVTIQSPTSNLSESLGTLTEKPSEAQTLLTQRCAALANGQASSFVVAGREQLPADPGSWLTSPLYAASVGEGQGVRGKGLEGLSTNEGREADTQILSLRRLTPVGFLLANFADSEATGCHS
ncbi:MAG: filamentous hemagglutinin N-terminal domain-containing protein [Nitrospira sp. CG24C]|jgi:filamentous hemagglutinin family protein|nr:MAG: filamentous hemagglutinin N-terminal domain-containing protein [Nitrospira sp. CG24C]